MNRPILLWVIFIGAVGKDLSAQSLHSPDQTELAKQLTIYEWPTLGYTVEATLKQLRRLSRDLDPAHKGVNIQWENLPPAARTYPRYPLTDLERENAHLVHLVFRNVSVLDAVRATAGILNLEVEAGRDAIVVRPKSDGSSITQLKPARLPVTPGAAITLPAAVGPAAELARRLIIPRVEMRSASIKEALEWAGTKSRELDPAREGVMITIRGLPASATDNQRTPVFLSLQQVSVWELIQRLAQAGMLEVTATNSAIIVHPKAKQ
jgi:hypothetical protein